MIVKSDKGVLATVGGVLALTACAVPEPEQAAFLRAAEATLAAMSARPGYVRGSVGRSLDDPERWVLASEWAGVGAYRRGLSAYDTKVALAGVMAYVVDEPSAYEVLASRPGGA